MANRAKIPARKAPSCDFPIHRPSARYFPGTIYIIRSQSQCNTLVHVAFYRDTSRARARVRKPSRQLIAYRTHSGVELFRFGLSLFLSLFLFLSPPVPPSLSFFLSRSLPSSRPDTVFPRRAVEFNSSIERKIYLQIPVHATSPTHELHLLRVRPRNFFSRRLRVRSEFRSGVRVGEGDLRAHGPFCFSRSSPLPLSLSFPLFPFTTLRMNGTMRECVQRPRDCERDCVHLLTSESGSSRRERVASRESRKRAVA